MTRLHDTILYYTPRAIAHAHHTLGDRVYDMALWRQLTNNRSNDNYQYNIIIIINSLTVHEGPALPLVSLTIFLCSTSSLTLHTHLSTYSSISLISFSTVFEILFLVFQVDVSYLFFVSEHFLINLHQLSTHVPAINIMSLL